MLQEPQQRKCLPQTKTIQFPHSRPQMATTFTDELVQQKITDSMDTTIPLSTLPEAERFQPLQTMQRWVRFGKKAFFTMHMRRKISAYQEVNLVLTLELLIILVLGIKHALQTKKQTYINTYYIITYINDVVKVAYYTTKQ